MTSRKGFKHLIHDDRVKIEALYVAGVSVREIAMHLGKSLATIYSELRRGTYMRMTSDLVMVRSYSADIAQKDYDYKATAKGASLKLANDYDLASYLENKIIEEKYSPAAAIASIKTSGKKFKVSICFKTLYNYIDKNIFLNLTNKDLLRKSTNKQKYQKVHPCRTKKPLCRSIETRPFAFFCREHFGHWEMDTVIGKRETKQVLLVLTERKTRYELIFKLRNKTINEVSKTLDCLERKHGAAFREIFKTITVDNGSEFLDNDRLEKSCRIKGRRTTIYYCHPYSSWERGSNENANAIIRRFIPKGTPLENYSDAQIKLIQHWINNYPRRILNYQCANDFIPEYFKAA